VVDGDGPDPEAEARHLDLLVPERVHRAQELVVRVAVQPAAGISGVSILAIAASTSSWLSSCFSSLPAK
jgi:hypothetical protein